MKERGRCTRYAYGVTGGEKSQCCLALCSECLALLWSVDALNADLHLLTVN